MPPHLRARWKKNLSDVRYKACTVFIQRFEHRLTSPRITIVHFHPKFYTFNPITWILRCQTTAGPLIYWYTLTLLNSKYALENAPGLLLTKSGFCSKSVVLPYHFVPTTTTDTTYLRKCPGTPKSHRQRPPSLHLNTARFSDNIYVYVRTHRTSG